VVRLLGFWVQVTVMLGFYCEYELCTSSLVFTVPEQASSLICPLIRMVKHPLFAKKLFMKDSVIAHGWSAHYENDVLA